MRSPKGRFWPESRREYLDDTPCRIVWRSRCLGAHLLRVPNESIEAPSREARSAYHWSNKRSKRRGGGDHNVANTLAPLTLSHFLPCMMAAVIWNSIAS